jgi:hypothetical protein
MPIPSKERHRTGRIGWLRQVSHSKHDFLKVCETEQIQKIARIISMRKPGHRWMSIHPKRKPPSID